MFDIKENLRLHIYSINDFHGAIESLLWWDKTNESVLNNSGIKLFSFLKKVKEGKENVILLSIGDMFQVQRRSAEDFSSLTSLLMREVGFDGMVIGNHEFDWIANSRDYFSQLSFILQCPLICCNLYHGTMGKRAEGIVTSKILNISSVKLGLIGVVTPQCEGLCTKEELGDYIINDTKENIKIEILKLKSLGVSSIILLAHMDIYYSDDNLELEGELVDIISAFDYGDIKLVLAGHSHQYIKGSVNGIPVIQAGAYGEALSYTRISFDEGTNIGEVDKLEIIKVSDINTFKVHPTIEEITLNYLNENFIVKQLIANLPLGLEMSNNRDKEWMEYVVELVREYALADVGMINNMFFRKPILGEEIYDQDILENIPFRNSLFSMKVKGDLLLEIFNSYGDEILRGAIFTGLHPRDIDTNKEYTLATTDFIANGGDSFILLEKGRKKHNHNVTIQEIVLESFLK